MDNYQDITFPNGGNERQLASILGRIRFCLIIPPWLMSRTEGEYRIAPVDLKTFDTWANKHSQFPHAIQYSRNTLVINVMLPPHDGAAGIIGQHISRVVDRMCPQNDADVWCHTGRINPLPNASDYLWPYCVMGYEKTEMRISTVSKVDNQLCTQVLSWKSAIATLDRRVAVIFNCGSIIQIAMYANFKDAEI